MTDADAKLTTMWRSLKLDQKERMIVVMRRLISTRNGESDTHPRKILTPPKILAPLKSEPRKKFTPQRNLRGWVRVRQLPTSWRGSPHRADCIVQSKNAVAAEAGYGYKNLIKFSKPYPARHR